MIGAAKTAVVTDNQAELFIVVENLGPEPLTEVSVVEDLDNVFGPGNYSVVSGPVATQTLVANPQFNGSTDMDLLLLMGSTLPASGSAETVFTIELTSMPAGDYLNQVAASGTAPDRT